MKLLPAVALSLLLSLGSLVANPHGAARAKITKNEAEHIALKRYPGARVTSAKLQRMRGASVWLIAIATADAKSVGVEVDATSGRVVAGKN